MRFHHVGVAVRDLDEALRTHLEIFGHRLCAGPVDVPHEAVRVCFVEARPGVLVELVQGLDDGSPVAGLLAKTGGGPYHICYEVGDLDAAIRELRRKRCFPFRRFEMTGYAWRRFAFLLTPDRQLFELCEPDHHASDRS